MLSLISSRSLVSLSSSAKTQDSQRAIIPMSVIIRSFQIRAQTLVRQVLVLTTTHHAANELSILNSFFIYFIFYVSFLFYYFFYLRSSLLYSYSSSFGSRRIFFYPSLLLHNKKDASSSRSGFYNERLLHGPGSAISWLYHRTNIYTYIYI